MRISPNNRAVLDVDEVIEAWMRGVNDATYICEENDAVKRFNEQCELFNRPAKKLPTADEPFEIKWFIGEELAELSLRDYFLALVDTDEQIMRVNEEMDLYEKYELIPVLRAMIYLVDHFRANNIVWGVGRGSSVASYLLYLIGVHRIDPLRFNLPISDFLKP